VGLARAPRRPYLGAMALPRPASPRALLSDLRTFVREHGRHQWVAALVAISMPVVIIFLFVKDAQTNIAPGEQITYVESWSSNRTDAEILAAQKKREAEQKAIAEERQRQFKELERRFGMDGK
jgi:uncharacterized membrane protein YfbV (UPF0208 family)